MVNQNQPRVSSNSQLSAPARAALDLVPDSHSFKRSQIDEIIGSLANAYENKRARQVVEWDRLSKQNLSDLSYRAFS